MVNDVHSVTFPEKKWLEDVPDLTIPPVLAQDVSWIDLSRNMIDRWRQFLRPSLLKHGARKEQCDVCVIGHEER